MPVVSHQKRLAQYETVQRGVYIQILNLKKLFLIISLSISIFNFYVENGQDCDWVCGRDDCSKVHRVQEPAMS